jgi:hypothetical protein
MQRAILSIFLFTFVALAPAKDHQPPALQPATNYPAVDFHATEQVAVAADPCDTPDKCAFFRIDYLKYGFLPVRAIVTNNSDASISLAEARIDFYTGEGDKVLAAVPEDVERRTDTIANPATPGVVLPAPFPRIHAHSHNKDKQIQGDFDAYGFQSLTVEAHATRAGFLFYNIQGLGHPLEGARLEVRELRDASGKDLAPFDVSFDNYPAARRH